MAEEVCAVPKLSLELALAIGGLVLAIVLVVFDKAGKLKGLGLLWLLVVAALMTLPLALGNSLVVDAPSAWKWWLRGAMVALVGFSYWGIAIWISSPVSEKPRTDQQQKEQQAVPTAGPARPTSQKDKDSDSESYIPWGNDKITIINSGFGHLPDVKAARISNSLLDSGIAGSIRIVFVGAFYPELADELFAEFQRGGWKPEILQVDTILEKHAQESLYLLSPDLGGQKARAAIDALESADLSIPAYTGKPTVGPTSAGIPDVTIVIKQQ
jgi:hypothetical protein